MEEKKREPKPLQPVEAYQQRLGTPDWLFAAAKALARWAVGTEVSEAEYLRAIEAAKREVIGGA